MLDVIVVGAGIGGLVAAVELAARGKRVVVYESHDEPGGKIGVAQADGIEVDTGPSLLTWPAVLEGVFERAGARLSEHVHLVRPDPTFRYLWPDGAKLDLRPGRDGAIDSVRSAFGGDASRDLAGFLDHAARVWNVAAPEFVEHEAPDFFALLRRGLPGLRAARDIDAFSTMRSAVVDRVASPHLRSVLLRYATYAGSDPRRLPATLASIAHVEMGLGVFGVRGGMIEIVRALTRLAVKLDVGFHLGARVERLVVDGSRCSGVVLEGGTAIAARAVVSNADVAHLVATLLPREHRRRVDPPGEPTTSGLTVVVRDVRRGGADRRAAHTVAFGADPDGEVADLFDRRVPPRDPTVYACAQEVAHERAGWADDEPVFLMVDAPALEGSSQGGRDVFREMQDLEARMLERAQRRGVIGADARVVWRRTPLGLAARFPDSGGALYGPASHGWTAAFRRTPNAIASVPGLYVASGSAHPGGGVPLAALSGRAAARAVLKDLS